MNRKKKFKGAYLAMMSGNKETAEKVYKEQQKKYIKSRMTAILMLLLIDSSEP